MTLWFILIPLTLLGLVFLVPPLVLKNNERGEVARDRINAQIFRERLAELEASGLSAEELQSARRELEKNLALELDDAPPTAGQAKARWPAAASVMVLVPALALGGYWWSSADTRAMLAEAEAQAQTPNRHAGEMPDMETLVERLRLRLENEPGNLQGWNMLARSYIALERYPDAAKAYEKLLESSGGKDPQVLADYAESLALMNGENMSGRPEQLLVQALEADPDHPKSLWLAGMAAMQKQQADAAAAHWQRLLGLLATDSKDYAFLYEQLNKMGKLPQGVIAPTTASAPQISPAVAPEPASPAAGVAAIQVAVTLDEALRAQVDPADTLFVYARAVQGPRMPLAIARKQVGDLPVEVSLDDSMSMMEGMKLSSFPEIIVAARVSKSGQAIPQSGDLLGESAPLKLAGIQDTVSIRIGSVVE